VRGLLLLGADINIADATGKTPLDYALRFPAPDHETPTNNGALEYLLDDHLPVFWKRLFALTFARVPGHAVAASRATWDRSSSATTSSSNNKRIYTPQART